MKRISGSKSRCTASRPAAAYGSAALFPGLLSKSLLPVLLPAFLYVVLSAATVLSPAPLPAAEEETVSSQDAAIPVEEASAAPADAATLRSRLVAEALSYTGMRYTYAGTDRRSGFDCSGLMYRVYLDVTGVRFPRMVEDLFREGEPAAKGRLLPGDLVFFNTLGYVSHVGMYIGEGKFVHAENEENGVLVTSLSTDYYIRTYVGARRHIGGPEEKRPSSVRRETGRGKTALYSYFEGSFTSSFGAMELTVLDPFGNVQGEYRNRDGIGRIWGKIDPGQEAFIGKWSHTGNRGSVRGEVRFYLSEDGDGLSGYWRKQGQRSWEKNWDAVRR